MLGWSHTCHFDMMSSLCPRLQSYFHFECSVLHNSNNDIVITYSVVV